MTTTPTRDEAASRLAAGRARAAELQPYLSSALFALKPVREPRIPTLGVDKYWRVYWNPEFISTLTNDQIAACWLHEVGHVLRDHGERFARLSEPQSRQPLFNKAGDAAINDDLRTAGVHLPPIKAIYPEVIPGATPGMTAEEMYRLLLNTPEGERVTATQTAPVTFMPGVLLEHSTAGQTVLAKFRDRLDTSSPVRATLTGSDGTSHALSNVTRRNNRAVTFSIDQNLPADEYTVTFATGRGAPVTGVLPVMAPSISVRPDHIPSSDTAPHLLTITVSHPVFDQTTTVMLTHPETGAPVTVAAPTLISDTTIQTTIPATPDAGVYRMVVMAGPHTMETALPVGVPFMDLYPSVLSVGHGTPYPCAAVTDDLTITTNTTFTVKAITPDGVEVVPGAVGSVTVKNLKAADFTLDVSLPEGSYLVVANTDGVDAVAVLSVAPPGSGGDPDDTDADDSEDSEDSDSGTDSDDSDDSDGSGNSDSDDTDESGDSDESDADDAGGRDDHADYDDCGSGAGGEQREWEQGEDPNDGSVDEGRGNLIREQVARDIAEHARTRGTIPGGWERWADRILKPQVDWRKELRAVTRRTAAMVAGMKDYTYTRPSRRNHSMPNVVLPALRAPRPPEIAAVIDTSGSVSPIMLGQAIGDVRELLNQITRSGGDHLTLIACDAKAATPITFSAVRELTSLEGGGGTDMRVGINAAAELTPKPDLILVFTDGGTPWPTTPPTTNPKAKYVVVLLEPDGDSHHPIPNWMHVVRLDDAYLREHA